MVRLSPDVLDKLGAAFAERSAGSESEIVRWIIQYVIQAFQEDWDELHQAPDGVRSYYFYGDELPPLLFYATRESTVIYDFALVEETVLIFDVVILDLDASSLDDPDDSAPAPGS